MSTIAWACKGNATAFYVFELGHEIPETEGTFFKRNKLPAVIKHCFFPKEAKRKFSLITISLVSIFKIGGVISATTDDRKIVFGTTSKLFKVPFVSSIVSDTEFLDNDSKLIYQIKHFDLTKEEAAFKSVEPEAEEAEEDYDVNVRSVAKIVKFFDYATAMIGSDGLTESMI